MYFPTIRLEADWAGRLERGEKRRDNEQRSGYGHGLLIFVNCRFLRA